MGLLLISHNLPLVRSFCDRVLVMYAGRVVETCIAAELNHATHPYTRGLLEALPSLDHRRAVLPQLRARSGLDDGRDRAEQRVRRVRRRGRAHAGRCARCPLKVAEGEAFGLVGESGSGKSTVLRAIAGLAPLDSGEILLAGKKVAFRRDRADRRLVQMVFQDPYGSLHPQHTIDAILTEAAGDSAQWTMSPIGSLPPLDEVGLSETHRYRFFRTNCPAASGSGWRSPAP